jgi:hypothetical protein
MLQTSPDNRTTDNRASDSRSIGELLGDLTREVSALVRDEVNLAKTELSQKAAGVTRHLGGIAIGGVLTLTGLWALVYALIVALRNVMPEWAASLLVGAIVIGIGGALVMKGINALKAENLAPQQTIETLKEDAQWAKQQIK